MSKEESTLSELTTKERGVVYIVCRLTNGKREYLYGVNPWMWSPRRLLSLRFPTARAADKATRGVGWRIILEVSDR